MKSVLGHLLLVLGVGARLAWSCDCGLLPVCAYRTADVVFLGRVSFTNDDQSGKITQATLVRFEVEESFKGVAPGVHQIWVDPGSFTSCYEVYRLANRYLIFGTLLPTFPQTSVMTMLPGSSGRTKPFPPDFNSAAPPPLYYSPECAGSRHADNSPGFEQDLTMLRAYRAGVPLPRVLGHVHLWPFLGWPDLDGPPVAGTEVTVYNGAVNLKTRADETGRFWLRDIPAGDYAVRADLRPYQMSPEPLRFWGTESVNGSLHVPETGCGYTEVQLVTTSTIQGTVLDPQGRGAEKIPVRLQMKEDPRRLRQLFAITDKQGRFTVSGVPDADVYVLAGVDFDLLAGGTNVDMDMRYRTVYYPSGSSVETASPLRLRPGETRKSLVLRLGTPLRWNHVKVKVLDKDGRPRVGADVDLYGGPGPVLTKTHQGGLGYLSCLSGWKYELEAAAGHSQPDGKWDVLVTARTPFICGDQVSPIVLELDHTMRGIVAGQTVDEKGIPLAYPLIRVYRTSETTPQYETRGDENGQFRIEDVEAGLYKINIAVPGFGEKTLSDVGVSPGFITNLGAMIWM